MTLSDQHSSPNDPFALTRILDARDALEPCGTWDRVREVVGRYGIEVVVLNDRFPEPPSLDYWRPTPEWFAAARTRLDGAPAAFEPVFDTGDFVVYRVHRAALDTLAMPVPARPYVTRAETAAGPGCRPIDPGLPALCGFQLVTRQAARGDTIAAIADWRAVTPLRPASYFVALRCDRPLPDAARPPVWAAKPARKVLERLRGERYRFRADHLPVGGAYGLDLWRPDEVVRDSFTFVVPDDVAPGEYRVRIRMVSQPHYPNLRLRDYLFEDDYLSGLEVGTLVVGRRSGTRGS